MPTLKEVSFKSWSFSRLQDYRKCPAYACYKHLRKMKDAGNKAMARGSDIHTMAEVWVKGGGVRPLPEELKLFKKEFKHLAKQKDVKTEDDWSFTQDWGQCRWNDWDICWLRQKIDVHYIELKKNLLVVVDYKTGSVKEDDHVEQRKLYAPGGLLRYPNVTAVRAEMWYTDEGVLKGETYTRADLPALLKYWEKETRPMFADRKFQPRPGSYCSWCPYSKKKGGPCKY